MQYFATLFCPANESMRNLYLLLSRTRLLTHSVLCSYFTVVLTGISLLVFGLMAYFDKDYNASVNSAVMNFGWSFYVGICKYMYCTICRICVHIFKFVFFTSVCVRKRDFRPNSKQMRLCRKLAAVDYLPYNRQHF